MSIDLCSRFQDQIMQMKRQQNEWELEKSTFQSRISSLKEEEDQWLNLKDTLLSRLRILKSASAAPLSEHQEILSQLSSLPAFQPPNSDNSQNDTKSNSTPNNAENDNSNENDKTNPDQNEAQSTKPLVSPARVRKISGKEIKKRKSLMAKSKPLESEADASSSSFPYKLKYSLSQHLDCVRCIAFHPTLPYIATGSDDGCIRITNLDPQKKTKSRLPVQLMCLRGHSGPVLSLASYHNNLISGDVNGQVCVWDFSETKSAMNESHGRVDHHLLYFSKNHTDAVWSIAVNENSPYFVTASSDKTIRINDFQTRQSTAIEIPDGPTSAIFNTDGSLFIIGCMNGFIHVFENKKEIYSFDFHSPIITICPSNSKDEIFVACEDKNINIFDLQNKTVKKQIIAHEMYTSAMSLTADYQFLITTCGDKTIRAWSIPDFEVVSAEIVHREKYGEAGLCVASTLPINSHNYFASGGADGVVKVFMKNK